MSYVLGSGSKLYINMTSYDGGSATNNALELPFVSESLNPSAEFINSNNLSIGRSTGVGKKGNVVADGSFETEVSFHNIVWLLTGALGSLDTTLDEITPNSSALPTFDIYVRHGSGSLMPMKFTGAKFNNFSMDLVSNAVLTASIDVVGLSYSTDDVGATVTDMVTDHLFYPSSLSTFTIAGEDVLDDVTSFNFAINNNFSTDLSKLDGSGRIALVPGELAITGSFEAIIDSSDPLGLKSKDIGDELTNGIGITFTSTASDTVTFTFNNVYITNISHDVSDRGVLKYSIDFQAFQSGTTPPLKVSYSGTNILEPSLL